MWLAFIAVFFVGAGVGAYVMHRLPEW